jgi:hypothetical protein
LLLLLLLLLRLLLAHPAIQSAEAFSDTNRCTICDVNRSRASSGTHRCSRITQDCNDIDATISRPVCIVFSHPAIQSAEAFSDTNRCTICDVNRSRASSATHRCSRISTISVYIFKYNPTVQMALLLMHDE